MSGGDSPGAAPRETGFAKTTTRRFALSGDALTQANWKRNSRRERALGPLTRWPDNLVDAKSGRAYPAHDAAVAGWRREA
jgi:hypothetical protein